ncbi:MAG: ABC transporter ATP-binding protein [Candidatus Gracilibacteria bacterium]|nr:ABC transporter ATP-binding protein [Candidatus Gracilibacteria bacterium]MDD2908939.1 ABC transporter ATP-binding protein [Candidatus Gracilibacteria bacterium]
MKPKEKNIIEMDNLHKSYYLENGVEIPVLKGIDLKIKQNEFVAIMGESGSGKSTLLNIIGFLHPLTSGKYYLEGDDLSEIKDDETLSFIRNKKIGFIFQQFYLLPKLNSIENVGLPSVYAGISNEKRVKESIDILKKVGLEDKLYSRPGELSGGQQQRVAIARSLINKPEILLADEPTGNLDSATTNEIMKIITDFKNEGKTIIMVTHAVDVAEYADRIIYLKDGQVLSEDYKI